MSVVSELKTPLSEALTLSPRQLDTLSDGIADARKTRILDNALSARVAQADAKGWMKFHEEMNK